MREPDKTSVTEVAKKHRIGEQTIYKWRRQRGTLEPADIRRLRGLDMPLAEIRRLLAQPDPESREEALAPPHVCCCPLR